MIDKEVAARQVSAPVRPTAVEVVTPDGPRASASPDARLPYEPPLVLTFSPKSELPHEVVAEWLGR